VNRIVLVIVGGGLAVAAAVLVLMPSRPAPKPSPQAARVEPAAPAPIAKDEPMPAPRPAPAPSSPRAARRDAAKRPADAAPEAPAVPAVPSRDAGILHIDSDVAGAQVFLDRVFVGAAPVTANDVTPGTHRLNVSAPGYEGVAETLEVTAGSRDIVVKLKEVRLDATLAVVHKHRIGSCRGQLIATPRGIRYDTTDKDDGFNVPLTDLETFQVDYMAKNLTVKLQKGRRYDFTDPGGNADRLFVFHRDVEKARDRLKKGDPPATP
jgi:hypothetical protein